MPNKLINETSPYLKSHANNPVDWYPWGDEAFAAAKKRDVPLLVSVGYSACHWCHVMAHESFENQDTADIMNKLFVNVKIDREERPDLDMIFQDCLALLGIPGGWPATLFLTPDGKAFFGGTYFPPHRSYGRPGFGDLLQMIFETWHTKKNDVYESAESITETLRDMHENPETVGDMAGLSAEDPLSLSYFLLDMTDTEHGGLEGAPKFPCVPVFDYLFNCHTVTGDTRPLQAVTVALEKMASGGLFDHVGGGFARYAVDNRWLVPHFEKMLYDNAQLIDLLARVCFTNPHAFLYETLDKTAQFLTRNMRTDTGCFAAAFDADSQGEEGKFYTWSKAEIEAILGDDSKEFCTFYNISEQGNWDGTNIINRLHKKPEPTPQNIKKSLAKLYDMRQKRTPPERDDKILTDWNAMAIAALATSGLLLGRTNDLQIAVDVFNKLEKLVYNDKNATLLHSWCGGKDGHTGFLDDYSFYIRALICLFEASGEKIYLDKAIKLADTALGEFSNDKGGFMFCGKADELAPSRKMTLHDHATPSGNAVMVDNLFKLSRILLKPAYADQATKTIDRFSGMVDTTHWGVSSFCSAWLFARYGVTACCYGKYDLAKIRKLKDSLCLAYPDFSSADKTGFQICDDQSCLTPVNTPDDAKDLIKTVRRSRL